MMKKLFLFLALGSCFLLSANAATPLDSLRAAESQLTSIVKEAHRLSELIRTPSDMSEYYLDLSLMEKRMSRLEQDYPMVVTDEYLS